MDDKLDAMFAPPEAEQAAEAPAVTPEPQPAQESVAQPAPQPEVTAEPEKPQAQAEEHTVPLAKYLDQRDELKELRRFKQEQEASQAKQQPQKAPDPIDDPDGFANSLRQEMTATLEQQRWEDSFEDAVDKHGKEQVEAARAWAVEKAKADPGFEQNLGQQRRPFDWIVRQHARDAELARIGDGPLDDVFARWAAEKGYVLPSAVPGASAPGVVPTAGSPPAPPRSQASDTSVTGDAPQGDPRAEFLAIFER